MYTLWKICRNKYNGGGKMNGPDKMEPSEIIDPWEDYEEEEE